MSTATEAITAWRQGGLSREELVDRLVSIRYHRPSHATTLDRHKAAGDAARAAWETEDADRAEPGTWGEVRVAMLTGVLPREVYLTIVDRLWSDRG